MSIDHEYVVAGTGSRSLQEASPALKRDAAGRVERRLSELLAERGDYLMVMSGMAEGFDKLLAVTALKLHIPLWCAIPNRGYGDYYWRRASLTGRDQSAEWARIVNAACRVTYVMEEIHGTSGLKLDGVHANFLRNDWMIQQAHRFLVWDPTSKGTAHCLAGVKRAGLPYEVLSPEPAQAALAL